MRIEPASEIFRGGAFQGSEGLVVWRGIYILAYVAWSVQDGPEGRLFYVHSLRSTGAEHSQRAVSMLIQALRKKARDLGFKTLNFYVAPEQPALLRLAESGRAQVKQIWMEMKV